MTERKKSGRLYLRMDPATHGRVAGTAKALGTDINGILNLILREGLPRYEMEAQMLRRSETLALLEQWGCLNPTRGTWDFFADYFRAQRGQPVIFEDGKRYILSQNEQTGECYGFMEEPECEPYRPPICALLAEYGDDSQAVALVQNWQRLNSGRSVTEFIADCRNLRLSHPCRFQDGKYYRLNAKGDGFIETPGGEDVEIPF